MTKKFAVVAWLFLVLFVGSTFAADDNYSVKPKFEIEQVIKTAKEFAVEQGRKLDKYFISRVNYDWSDKERKWTVFFQGNIPAPGNDFAIVLDEKTGKKQLFAGE